MNYYPIEKICEMKNLVFTCVLILLPLVLICQSEKLEVEGAIVVGKSTNMPADSGTIQWNGSTFEGFDGGDWIGLGSFDPEYPKSFKVDSVKTLNGASTYTVPAGFNFYITDYNASGIHVVDGVQFNGFNSYLGRHIAFALGENMTLTNATSGTFSANGFLTKKDRDLIVIDFSSSGYTVPAGKTLFITIQKTSSTLVDGVAFNGVRVLYSGQTLTGSGSFIGFLK